MRSIPWKPALVTLSLVGCASAPAPLKEVADSGAAIRSADEMGARDVPAAALHLQLAREHYDRARTLVKDDEPTQARYALMRAEADAEVALALAKEHRAKMELAALTNPTTPTNPGDNQ